MLQTYNYGSVPCSFGECLFFVRVVSFCSLFLWWVSVLCSFGESLFLVLLVSLCSLFVWWVSVPCSSGEVLVLLVSFCSLLFWWVSVPFAVDFLINSHSIFFNLCLLEKEAQIRVYTLLILSLFVPPPSLAFQHPSSCRKPMLRVCNLTVSNQTAGLKQFVCCA